MNVINELIHHQQFGSGKVTNQTMNIVTVKFRGEYGVKKFVYPNAFESYLELCNPNVKHEMNDVLLENLKQEELERLQHIEEEERRIMLEQKPKTVRKKAAPKKKSTAKTKEKVVEKK